MIFRQFLHQDHEHVSCASYLIADAGQAVVVDPAWDIGAYLETARAYHLTISHVLDTHVHSDHLSGAPRLAAATGAELHLPEGAGEDVPGSLLLPLETFTIGTLRLTAVPAPGHRPEHLAVAVSDGQRAQDVRLVLTGDSLAVESVMPPDYGVDEARAAADLHGTLSRLAALPDGVEIWPGHVAGPLGGLGLLSQKTSSTIGAERRLNPFLGAHGEAGLAAALGERTWPYPPLAGHVTELNRRGQSEAAEPALLDALEADRAVRAGAVVIDGRHPDRFDAGHVPGSLNVPLDGRAVGTRVATLLGDGTDLVLVGEAYRDSVRLALLLESAGLDRIVGTLAGGIAQRGSVPLPVATAEVVRVKDAVAAAETGALTLIDVREPQEWEEERFEPSMHAPLTTLATLGLDALPPGPVAVVCQVGNRAALAASLLRRRGVRNVARVSGGGVPDLIRARERAALRVMMAG